MKKKAIVDRARLGRKRSQQFNCPTTDEKTYAEDRKWRALQPKRPQPYRRHRRGSWGDDSHDIE